MLIPDVDKARKVLCAGDVDLRLEAIGEAGTRRFQDGLYASQRRFSLAPDRQRRSPSAMRPLRWIRVEHILLIRSGPRRKNEIVHHHGWRVARGRRNARARRIDRLELPLRL